jgi:hypothetical protein
VTVRVHTALDEWISRPSSGSFVSAVVLLGHFIAAGATEEFPSLSLPSNFASVYVLMPRALEQT